MGQHQLLPMEGRGCARVCRTWRFPAWLQTALSASLRMAMFSCTPVLCCLSSSLFLCVWGVFWAAPMLPVKRWHSLGAWPCFQILCIWFRLWLPELWECCVPRLCQLLWAPCLPGLHHGSPGLISQDHLVSVPAAAAQH